MNRKEIEAAEEDAGKEVIARFAANVRHWRRVREMTQAELADTVRVEPLSIRSIEGARHRPSFALLVRLSLALDVDVRELFKRRRSPERPRGRPRRE